VAGGALQLDPHQTCCQMAYTLFCIVPGDKNLFSVKVDETQTVDELKKAIKSENSHKFENVDAYELTLHQIEINLDVSNEDEYDRILDEVSQPGYVFTPKRKLRDVWGYRSILNKTRKGVSIS